MIRHEVTEATAHAVDFIIENLWERGRKELDLMGYDLDSAMGAIQSWRQQNLPTMAVSFEGKPVFMAGLVPVKAQVMQTWFQATDEFTTHARQITVILRKRLEEEAEARNLAELEIYSMCVHPKSSEWFGLLGFSLDHDYHHVCSGGARLYRFVRRFDHKVERDVLS